jgi:cell division protein FtsI (penicillin-binding protein 3)
MVRLSRVSVIHVALGLFALLLIAKAAHVQLVEGEQWAERARRQQFRQGAVEAPRGKIFDATGTVLAESRELVRINIAPNEVKDPRALAAAMQSSGFDRASISAASNRKKKWITLDGLYVAAEIGAVTALSGVHPEVVVTREYVPSQGIRRVIGAVDKQGKAFAGIELALDSILRGDSVRSSTARDAKGRRLDSPESWETAPRAGANVTLTINRDLQEIAERALTRAIDSLEATGGDIVVLNPSNGEILAMVSRRTGKASLTNTAVSEPFEPGSTLKPFIAAALLERHLARTDEIVDTHNGTLTIGSRTITDLHKAPQMNLADVIRYSSNIGIVTFGSRLSLRDTYETLRDLGFGASTGVPIPGEADGVLREPSRWRSTSAASLAMGYEISVTPLQLVSAYAALANGGHVMQPHIVREIRDTEGGLIYHARPRVLRTVFSEPVARDVRRLLMSVVDSGTGMKADLATFQMAGKSGTARRTSNGVYVEGNYTASFVGLFPGDRPQYVVLVKLDSPRRAFYGGEIAAPVSAVVLRAALAARDAALDRAKLASEERRVPLPAESTAARAADMRVAQPVMPAGEGERTLQPPVLISLPYRGAGAPAEGAARPVPDVASLDTRGAVRALHRAGFRVTLAAIEVPTVPSAGTLLPPRSVVKLRHIH